jgi:hypothetical protein
VVSVLAIGPKARGFKPVEDDSRLMAIQFRSTTFFGGEVKPSVVCRKILLHVRERCEYERDTS